MIGKLKRNCLPEVSNPRADCSPWKLDKVSLVWTLYVKDWTKDTFTAHSLLLPFCASFIPRLANTGDIDIPNLWVISKVNNEKMELCL